MKITVRKGDSVIQFEEKQELSKFLKTVTDSEKILKTIEHITDQVIKLNTLENE